MVLNKLDIFMSDFLCILYPVRSAITNNELVRASQRKLDFQDVQKLNFVLENSRKDTHW